MGGVAQIANRVAFCMAMFLYFYTTIIRTISHLTTICLNGLAALTRSQFLTRMVVKTQFLDITGFISNTSRFHCGDTHFGSSPWVVKQIGANRER